MDGFNGGGIGEAGESSSPVQPRGGAPPVAQRGSGFEVLSISFPKGGAAIHGIGEIFAANSVTSTDSMIVPITTSLGRSGFGPQLSLSYDSGAGNGSFGFGWNLSLPAITRKADKGLPKYRDANESDVFLLPGAEGHVPVLKPDGSKFNNGTTVPDYTIHRYRPLQEAIPSGHDYCFLIHDRDCIFSSQLDQSITHMGLRVLRTPYRSPKDNSFCERVIGTLRREYLDFLIPLTENYLCIVGSFCLGWITLRI